MTDLSIEGIAYRALHLRTHSEAIEYLHDIRVTRETLDALAAHAGVRLTAWTRARRIRQYVELAHPPIPPHVYLYPAP